MAAKYLEEDSNYVPEVGEEDVAIASGPVNIRQAKDYEEGLDGIV